jgi:hypothetical protein
MVQGWRDRLPWQGLLLVSLLALSPFGCIHLHNQAQADLAKETAGEFKKFQDSSGNFYVQMLGNLEKADQAMAARQAEVAREKEEAFCNRVSNLKWMEVEARISRALEEINAWKGSIDKAIADLLKERKEKESGVTSANRTMEDTYKLLQQGVMEKNKWEAKQIFFRSTIKFMANVALTKEGKVDIKGLELFKKDVLDQEITIEEVQTNGNIIHKKPSLGKFLGEDIKILTGPEFKELLKKYSINLADPLKAPGLTVTILSLGMDLAQAQFEKARLEVNYLKARIELLEIMKEIANSSPLKIKESLQIMKDRKEFARSEKVIKTLNRLRHGKDKEKPIQDALKILAVYGVTQTMDKSLRRELETRPDMWKHKYSIQVSAINAKEHEALVSRGLQGLVIYHEGGLKQETIANLLRAAQAVALSIIGAGLI